MERRPKRVNGDRDQSVTEYVAKAAVHEKEVTFAVTASILSRALLQKRTEQENEFSMTVSPFQNNSLILLKSDLNIYVRDRSVLFCSVVTLLAWEKKFITDILTCQ